MRSKQPFTLVNHSFWLCLTRTSPALPSFCS